MKGQFQCNIHVVVDWINDLGDVENSVPNLTKPVTVDNTTSNTDATVDNVTRNTNATVDNATRNTNDTATETVLDVPETPVSQTKPKDTCTFQTKVAAPGSSKRPVKPKKSLKSIQKMWAGHGYFCYVCRAHCINRINYDSHLKGKKHLKNWKLMIAAYNVF